MKNILFFLFVICLGGGIYAQTNVYHPFPDSNAMWRVSLSSATDSGFYSCLYHYILIGDTTINSFQYRKIYKQGYCDNDWWPYTHQDIDEYRGALREDVNIKTAFIVPSNDSVEYIFYDFNLNISDTLKGYLFDFSSDGYFIKVDSIDSVLINYQYRKRYHLNCCVFPCKIIEGIGTTCGLFDIFPFMFEFTPSVFLECFQQDSKTLYPDTNYLCQLVTSEKENIKNDNDITISISPNPTHKELTISLGENKMDNIEFYDQLGIKLFTFSIRGKNTLIINNINLLPGFYLLALKSKHRNTIYKKIIVQ